jgi:dephospho-CoA kinase
MPCVGLTGGIGSGKSTVAHLLVKGGAALIDADAVSRASTQAGGLAMPAIAQGFGSQVLAPDGSLNREAMRSLMLREASAKARLEAIIHPIVGQQMAAQRQQAQAAGHAWVVMDIPLLVEAGTRWRSQLDAVWVVDCSQETQIQRVMHRSGWPRKQVQSMMSAQATRAARLACADLVIVNEGTLEQLEAQVQALLQHSLSA